MVVVSLDQMSLDVLVPLAAQREMAIAQHQRGNYKCFICLYFVEMSMERTLLIGLSTLLLYYCHHNTMCRKTHSHLI